MEVFFDLLYKVLPLYFIIFLGFAAGRFLKAQKETIASILIYILTPVIVFHGVATSDISLSTVVVPVLFWIIGTTLCLLFYIFGKKIWQDTTKNILAYTAGTGNIGYFGLPVAVAIFGDSAITIVALCVMGFVLYENTIGFYITARGHHTFRETIDKLVKLPSIYAFFLGIVFSLSKISLSPNYFDFIILIRGAYTVLGMMLIGLAISEVKTLVFDYKFILLSFLAKFLIWPVFMFLVIFADNRIFDVLTPLSSNVLMLLSLAPLAANTVAWATILKTKPEKASVAVLLSTLFALVYIPLAVSLFIK